VALAPVHQIGAVQVALHHHVLTIQGGADLVGDADALSAAASDRLDNIERRGVRARGEGGQVLLLLRQDEGLGDAAGRIDGAPLGHHPAEIGLVDVARPFGRIVVAVARGQQGSDRHPLAPEPQGQVLGGAVRRDRPAGVAQGGRLALQGQGKLQAGGDAAGEQEFIAGEGGLDVAHPVR
jgi:hypothetical protein